jgi:hypothetical protein
MIRALLEGRKTQTRRIVKPGPPDGLAMHASGDGWRYEGVDYRGDAVERCPYGVPGDRLWVREAWSEHVGSFGESRVAFYRADGDERAGPWKPSIHMPRWASRITLELTDVRVQRLQEISEEDAKAEGIQTDDMNHVVRPDGINWGGARGEFAALWESINGKRAPWDSNPFVWCLTFKLVKP